MEKRIVGEYIEKGLVEEVRGKDYYIFFLGGFIF